MGKLSLQGFYDFVAEQPADREIDQGRGWDECAVGDYVKHVEGVINDRWDFRASDWVNSNESLFPYKFLDVLGSPNRSQEDLSTYGALNKFIAKNR